MQYIVFDLESTCWNTFDFSGLNTDTHNEE